MSAQPPEPTEEEIRAALEEQMKHLRVEDVVLQTVVSLVNLGARRTGLGSAPPDSAEQDLEQARMAIEAVRRLLPLVEPQLGPDAKPIRDALSQLQLAWVQAGGTAPEGEAGPGPGDAAAPAPSEPPAAEAPSAVQSGRLWVPGQ